MPFTTSFTGTFQAYTSSLLLLLLRCINAVLQSPNLPNPLHLGNFSFTVLRIKAKNRKSGFERSLGQSNLWFHIQAYS